MFEFKMWRDASSLERPLLVFVPGFLTEESVRNNQAWVEQLVLFAIERDYAVGGVLWASNTLKGLLDIDTLSLASMSSNFVNQWSESARKSESVVGELLKMSSYFKGRKTHLIGHSLGARIALRVAEQAPQHTFHSVVAMAAACDPAFCDFEMIEKKTKRKPLILFSNADKVLEFLFPTAQNQKNFSEIVQKAQSPTTLLLTIGAHYLANRNTSSALGYLGTASHAARNIDASQLLNTKVGHLTYERLVRDILKKLKI